jgi:hypothetical protein
MGSDDGMALLGTIAIENTLEPACTVLEGDCARAVGRPGVEDDDLGATLEGAEHPVETLLGISSDENR